MAVRSFGTGTFWAVPSGGSPIKFGTLQKTQVTSKLTTDKLYGQDIYPEAIGMAKGELTGKATYARMSAAVLAYLFPGAILTTGGSSAIDSELGTIPSSGAYTVTVANSATWTADLGVFYKATGIPMQEVASNPAQGQYSVAAGIYTFNVADKGLQVQISYLCTQTGGQTVTIANAPQGLQPTFMVTLQTKFNGPGGLVTATLQLNSCISSDFAFGTDQGKFAMPDFSFDAQADSSGNVMSWYFSDSAS